MFTNTQRIEEISINLLSEFTFDENERILYWRNLKKDTEDLHRLTNFEIRIKRRFKLVGLNDCSDMITLILHGWKDLEITIPLSELSSLMKYIEKIILNIGYILNFGTEKICLSNMYPKYMRKPSIITLKKQCIKMRVGI